ncbi:MAG: hypothetical protein ACLGIN_07950 [Candidatus Sericytochromatia bacterium]
MDQLGLSATDVALFLEKERAGFASRLATFEQAALNAEMDPEKAREFAMVQYMHEFASSLLEANNRKLAADLIRLGVLAGTIKRGGEPAF